MNIKNKVSTYIEHITHSINQAKQGYSHLTAEILAIPGMSSPLIRHFLNNICSAPYTCYLEIGCWQGSTLISALYNNQSLVIDAIAIDNWSLHQGVRSKENFLHNVSQYLPQSSLRFFEKNCFDINLSSVFQKKVTVYFYDGQHSALSHEKAFTYFDPIFDDIFIAIIDDWNWKRVQKGTHQAFQTLSYRVLYKQEFFTAGNDSRDWWNGLCIAVIGKSK